MKNKFLYTAAIVALLSANACMKEDPNPAVGAPSPYISLEVLRSLHKGEDLSLQPSTMIGAEKISGIVISDTSGHNLPPGYFVMQDDKKGNMRGITLVMAGNAPVNVSAGDSLVINVTGTKLVNNKGALQITGVQESSIVKAGTGKKMKATSITLSALSKNFANYEGTLVEVNAVFVPEPVSGDIYKGDKRLSDGIDSTLRLRTLPGAAYAAKGLPASASFKGIPLFDNNNGTQRDTTAIRLLSPRTEADIRFASGPLYRGFPEDFESPDASQKSTYAAANVVLKTGEWLLDQALLGTTKDRDRFNPSGKQCIRMQQNLSKPAYVQMNYDLPDGASKVTLSYGAYYTDASSTWRLEYSTDKGATWQQAGKDIKDASSTVKVATIMLNIQVQVRFRITKLGLGSSNGTSILNGRLCVEDIAVYRKINQ